MRAATVGVAGVLALGLVSRRDKPARRSRSSARARPAMRPAAASADAGKRTVASRLSPRRRPGTSPSLTEPVRPKPAPQKVGKLSIAAEHCRVEGVRFHHNDTDVLKSVAVVGSKLYLLDHRGALWRFDLAAGPRCRLVLDKRWGKKGVLGGAHAYEKLSTGGKDRLVASGFMGSVLIRDGKVAYACKARHQGNVTLAPHGRWGLAHYSGSNVQKLEYGPKVCRGADWYLTHLRDDAKRLGPFKMVGAIGFWKKRILVAGALARKTDGWNPQVVAIFDRWGKQKRRFGALNGQGDERFGWIPAVAHCPAGPICVLDSNFRRLTLWSAKGDLKGTVDLTKLLGLSTPHPRDLALDARGNAWIVAAQVRALSKQAPKSARVVEGLIFRVTGL